jgi:hypothetical protein
MLKRRIAIIKEIGFIPWWGEFDGYKEIDGV